MKKWILISLLLFSGCQTQSIKNDDQRWLVAVEQMLAKNDPLVSTTNLNRIKILVEWASKNDYSITISDHDAVAGKKPGMYFAIIKKIE